MNPKLVALAILMAVAPSMTEGSNVRAADQGGSSIPWAVEMGMSADAWRWKNEWNLESTFPPFGVIQIEYDVPLSDVLELPPTPSSPQRKTDDRLRPPEPKQDVEEVDTPDDQLQVATPLASRSAVATTRSWTHEHSAKHRTGKMIWDLVIQPILVLLVILYVTILAFKWRDARF